MSNIEEVGARLVLLGRPAYKRGLREARSDVKALAADTVKSNRAMADATKVAAAATADYAKATQVAADATTKAMAAKTAAVKAAAAGDEEASVAAKKYADAMTAEMVAANNAKRAAVANKVAAASQVSALTASARAHDAHAQAVTRSGKAVTALASVGKTAVLGGLTAGAIAAYAGAKAFATYQQALEAVHTQAGLAQPRVDKLGRSLLKMSGSGNLPVGPTDMANILYRIASSTSGMHYSDARLLAMTKAAAQLAVIGGPGTDVEQTARIVGGIKATGIKGAGDPQNIVSLANATVGSGDLRMSDFLDFVGTGVLSSANLAGVTLPQVAGMLSLLGDNLQAGNVSGHSIAHALQLLAAPSHIGLQAYSAIGLKGTQLGDLMRTKGLPVALGTFLQHLKAPVSGSSDTAAYLKKYLGMSGPQIQQAQIHGLTKTEQDMILARAFGGAKQAIPIMTVLTEFDRYKAKLAESQKLMANFGETWSATMKEPANQLKALNAQWQTFEVELGSKVLPEALGAIGWMKQHKTLLKDTAVVLGVALIPATATWLGMVATRGVTAIGGLLGLMKNVGPAAQGSVGGLNGMGKAVMGVTAAIGVFELGRATAGHGAGGALTAGLGGALTGLMVGMQIMPGPIGALIGGAAGGLIGLAGHFLGVKGAVDQTTRSIQIMTGQLKSALQADAGVAGVNVRNYVDQFLQNNQATTSALAKYGVTDSDLVTFLSSGHATGSLSKLLSAGLHGGLDATGKTSYPPGTHAAAQAINNLQKAYGGAYGPASDYTKVTGHKAGGGRVRAGQLYQVNELGVELFRPDMDGSIVPHGQAHSDGCTVLMQRGAVIIYESGDPQKTYEAARKGMSDALARL